MACRNQKPGVFFLVEACKALLKEKFQGLLAANIGRPLLFNTQAVDVHTSACQGARHSRSPAKAQKSQWQTDHGVLCAASVSIADSDGHRQHCVLFNSPIALQNGKTIPALLSSALGCPGLRLPQQAPRIVILHQIHDLAMSLSYRHAFSGALAGTLFFLLIFRDLTPPIPMSKTSYCDPGCHANVVTPYLVCLPPVCLNVPKFRFSPSILGKACS